MTSDVNSGKIPDTSLVHGSQATYSPAPAPVRGKTLPSDGTILPARTHTATLDAAATFSSASDASTDARASSTAQRPAVKAVPRQPASTQAFVQQLNKHLNDSGRPDQFRLDNTGKVIQQVNPATGDVIGEFAVSEFPALARSVGASGLLVDDRA